MKLVQLPSGNYVNPELVEAVAKDRNDMMGEETLVMLNSGGTVGAGKVSREEVARLLNEADGK